MKVNCDVIKDLLPSYVDKVSSEATNKLVEEHLQKCEDCRMILKDMNKDVEGEIIENQEEEIDYLKGYRKRDKIKTRIFIVLWVIIIVYIGWILWSYFGDDITSVCIDINDIEIEYMYMTDAFYPEGEKLAVGFRVDGYNHLRLNVKSNYEEGEIYYKITSGARFSEDKGSKRWFTCFHLEEAAGDIQHIYIKDKWGHSREIWNKDMEVMTEEEWYNSQTETNENL